MWKTKTFSGKTRDEANQKSREWIASQEGIEVHSKELRAVASGPNMPAPSYAMVIEYRIPVGWIVYVTLPGNFHPEERWDAAIKDATEAANAVMSKTQIANVTARVTTRLFEADLHDLKAGEVRLRDLNAM